MRSFKLYQPVVETKYNPNPRPDAHMYDAFFGGLMNHRSKEWESVLSWTPPSTPPPASAHPAPKKITMGMKFRSKETPQVTSPAPVSTAPSPEFVEACRQHVSDYFSIWGELAWAVDQYPTVFITPTDSTASGGAMDDSATKCMVFQSDVGLEPVLISKLKPQLELELEFIRLNSRRIPPETYAYDNLNAFTPLLPTNYPLDIVITFGGNLGGAYTMPKDVFEFLALPKAIAEMDVSRVYDYICNQWSVLSELLGMDGEPNLNGVYENPVYKILHTYAAWYKICDINVLSKGTIPSDSNVNRGNVRNARTCYTFDFKPELMLEPTVVE